MFSEEKKSYYHLLAVQPQIQKKNGITLDSQCNYRFTANEQKFTTKEKLQRVQYGVTKFLHLIYLYCWIQL